MAKMSTEYYADYIKKTTFDPKSHSTRSKMEEHHEKDENGKVIEHPIEESMLGMRGSEKLNGGKSKDPNRGQVSGCSICNTVS